MAFNLRTPVKAIRVEIKDPEFINTGPRPEPQPHIAPVMSTSVPTKAAAPKVWRVADADIDDLMPWLHPKLLERWPRLEAEKLAFWMRAARADNRTMVCRSAGAVGAFMATQNVLEPWVTVTEFFVRCNTRETKDWLLVYDYAWTWASSIAARECRFGLDTDAKLGEIRRDGQEFGVDIGRQRAFYVSPVKGIGDGNGA